MNEISKLEARLDTALATLGEAGAGAANQQEKFGKLQLQVTDLQGKLTATNAELETANRQLERARNRSNSHKEMADRLKEEGAENAAAQEKHIAALKASQLDAVAQRDKAREFNQSLKKNISDLRRRNEEMIGDPELINTGVVQELSQLKEQRTVDMEEVNAILSRLTPLVEGN